MNSSKTCRGQSLTQTFAVLILLFSAGAVLAQPVALVYFDEVLEKRLTSESTAPDWSVEKFCPVSSDVVAMRVLQSYGSMFVARDTVQLPATCVHKGEADVLKFQQKLDKKPLEINGVRIQLQVAAATALEAAIGEATAINLAITPLDGAIAGGRSYGDTLMLWNSRVFPAIEFWIRRGRLAPATREEIGRLDLQKKIEKVIEWESQGIYFSTDRTRSIFTSTAPPGTSQHLSLLALDVAEYWNPQIRALMNRNGWFQTVVDDPPHFTYLGFPETELPSRGLIAIIKGTQMYWVPNTKPRINPTN